MPEFTLSLDTLPIKAMTHHAIVLDLDETLVHTVDDMAVLTDLKLMTDPQYLNLRDRIYIISLDDVVSEKGSGYETKLWGVLRPYVRDFLIFCFSYFRVVAVWSAGKPKYVQSIVELLFRGIGRPHVIYDWTDCKRTSEPLRKPLLKMIHQEPRLSEYMSLQNTFAIDDRDTTFVENAGNGIMIPVYSPVSHSNPTISWIKSNDIALQQLMLWLLRPEVKASHDVRTLDKSQIFTVSLSQASRGLKEHEELTDSTNGV